MTRSLLIAAAVSFVATAVLFFLNFIAQGIDQDRYRAAIATAVADGTMSRIEHAPFGPPKDIRMHGGNDCLILSMLLMPRETPLKASLSPRLPIIPDPPAAVGYQPDKHCGALAALMTADPSEMRAIDAASVYYHRYLHGYWTLLALLLAVFGIGTVSGMLFAACYGALALLAGLSLWKLLAVPPAERCRPLAFLILAGCFAFFYGLQYFGQQLTLAAGDLVIFLFLIFALLQPLGRISERYFAAAVAIYAAAIAVFEFLTGGIPTGLALLLALIALGECPDRAVLLRRCVLGPATFCVAVAACFVWKLLVLWIVWDQHEVAGFFDQLLHRMAGPTEPEINSQGKERMRQFLDLDRIDSSLAVRLVALVAVLVYSGFILAWGSHVVGGALVLIPLPAMLVLSYMTVRRFGLTRRSEMLLALLAAAMVPPVWYLVFVNHTIIHPFFMVRPMVVPLAIVFIAALYRYGLPETVGHSRVTQTLGQSHQS